MRKITFCCFVVVLLGFSLALAVDKSEKLPKNSVNSFKASDKSNNAKPKRDASFLIGSGYHGPSFKYLPPPTASSSVYDSYGGAHHGLGGGAHHHAHHQTSHGYAGHSLGHGHGSGVHSGHSGYAGHFGHSGLSGVKVSGISHGFAGSPTAGHSVSSALGGHSHGHGHGYALGGHHHLLSSGHGLSSSGHGSLGPVYTAGHGVLAPASSVINSHGSQGIGHAYITSAALGGPSLNHKILTSSVPSSYSLTAGHVGSAAGLATGYHYSKGISGSLPGSSLHSSGETSHLGSSNAGVGSSFTTHGFATNDLHHGDHVHNGNQEHHYVVTSAHDASGLGQAASHGLSAGAGDGYHYEIPSPTYGTPTNHQIHVQPSNSYGVPLATVGAHYSPNYHTQSSGDDSPNYAAGHKGLGHFSYTASKPSVLHTSFVDSGFKAPHYSNAPFKPSTFLGTKYEGSSFAGESSSSSSLGHSNSPQFLTADSSGYDYPVPSGAALVYQSPADNNSTPIHEPESTYLPPSSLDAGTSYNEVANNPSASYLTSNSQTYGTPH